MTIPKTEHTLILVLNGHVGMGGFEGRHGGYGFGKLNREGETILASHDLAVVNSFFKKKDVHLMTYKSLKHKTLKYK